MVIESPSSLRERLRVRLRFAMKDRHEPAITALRSALAAIDHAEAVGIAALTTDDDGSPIAGARTGVGSTDVARRQLDEDEIVGIVREEIAERETAAIALRRAGQAGRADRLQAEARVLASVVGER